MSMIVLMLENMRASLVLSKIIQKLANMITLKFDNMNVLKLVSMRVS